MKDPKAFWKLLFALSALVTALLLLFPAFQTEHRAVPVGASLEEDVWPLKAALPPGRYYVQHFRAAYLPDGTMRNLYLDLLSQQRADGTRISAQVTLNKGASGYEVVYQEVDSATQQGDLDFEDVPRLFVPGLVEGLFPEEPFDYVLVENRPAWSELDPHSQYELYLFNFAGDRYGLKPTKNKGPGLSFLHKGGYIFNVTAMHSISSGQETGQDTRQFLLGTTR